jgi:hypothetical protein
VSEREVMDQGGINEEERVTESKKTPQLGDEVPGLTDAVDHIMAEMDIALDDLLEGIQNRKHFIEEMRQQIRYHIWLHVCRRGPAA